MPAYDAIRFTPPAPLALVTFRNIAAGASASDVPMLLDSGADVSLVPRQAVRPLGVSIDPAAVHELMGSTETEVWRKPCIWIWSFSGGLSEADPC